MKKVNTFCITFLLFLFIFNPSFSQRTPLPTDSAQWIYQGFDIGNGDSIFIYRVKGDTILGNKTYSKVYRANDNDTNYYSTNETIYCFIRNDSNIKAYIRYPGSYCNDTNELLLYDYSLNIGDTFNVHLLQPRPGYPCLDSIYKFIVIYSNDSVPYYTNFYTKQIWLKIFNFPQIWCWGNHCSDELDDLLLWTEEVGTLSQTTFYNEYKICACCDNLLFYKFWLCGFWEKGKWLMDPCPLTTINEGIQNTNKIIIFPNPFTTSTLITLDKAYHNISLSLYDIQGKQMIQNKYTDCNSIQLSRNELGNGMYFLKLLLDERWVETGKIVISE